MSERGSRLREFMTELRRRHVFRVAVAYAVVAFVALQVADIAFPALALPDWSLGFIILLTIMGFPIALVLAWVFDVTQEGVRRTEPLAGEKAPLVASNRTLAITLVVVVIALAITAGWLVVSKSFDWSHAVAGRGAGERTMLAVLQFENLGKESDAYFADGITEEITARLASLQQLGVIARTSTLRYKKTDLSVQQIGEELGVEYILEGTVRWEYADDGPDRVRVTPQLIRVSDGTHIWAKIYEEPIASVFDVQTAIAEEVATLLDITLLEPERLALTGRPTDNIEAWEYFVRGNKYSEAGATTLGGQQALELYRMALGLDPDFTEAAIKLAETEADLYWAARIELLGPADEAERKVRRLSLWSFGDDTASYHLTRALLLQRLGDDDAALAHFDSAQRILIHHIAEASGDAITHAQLGLALAALGRDSDAVAEGKRALELVPQGDDSYASAAWLGNLAHIYVLIGDYENAIDTLENILRLGSSPLTRGWLLADPTLEPLRDEPGFQELMYGAG